MKIYHYTKFNVFVDYILNSKKLKFGDFKNTNDFREFFRYGLYPYRGPLNHSSHSLYCDFYKRVNQYKPICFSTDSKDRSGWDLPCMWAFYGDNHSGVCIELDLERISCTDNLLCDRVKYKQGLPAFEESKISNTNDDISQALDDYISHDDYSILFSKEKDWSVENEFRILSKELQYLDISDAITGVYFGYKHRAISDEIMSILNKMEDVNTYLLQTVIDSNGFQTLFPLDIKNYLYVSNLNEAIYIKKKQNTNSKLL